MNTIERPFWQDAIEDAWKIRSIVWLMGVRRVGKTKLCMSLPDVEYYDCEKAGVREMLKNYELFLESKQGKRIALDEIHKLDNPAEVLKVAADHYPSIKIIATGSSTLGASAQFSDTLAGRKREIWLTPLMFQELRAFGNTNLQHRFLFGGLPIFFENKELTETDFKEWMDAYWAKDIEEMFKVGSRRPFLLFAELLMANSGGLFEASRYTQRCEVVRPTIVNYLKILEETFLVHLVRPFSSHRPTEIVKAPKVYGFDTGFVCNAKSWHTIRQEDTGILWEHCVLNELHAHFQDREINYWRSKSGHEIDFVYRNRVNDSLIAIECKYSVAHQEISRSAGNNLGENIAAFRKHYPKGANFVVASDVTEPYMRKYQDLVIWYVNPKEMISRIKDIATVRIKSPSL